MRKLKTVLSFVLVLCLLFSSLPAVFAAEGEEKHVHIDANSGWFEFHEPDGRQGEVGGSTDIVIADTANKSLKDLGYDIPQVGSDIPGVSFIGWQVNEYDTANDDWTTVATGMTTADMLSRPLTTNMEVFAQYNVQILLSTGGTQSVNVTPNGGASSDLLSGPFTVSLPKNTKLGDAVAVDGTNAPEWDVFTLGSMEVTNANGDPEWIDGYVLSEVAVPLSDILDREIGEGVMFRVADPANAPTSPVSVTVNGNGQLFDYTMTNGSGQAVDQVAVSLNVGDKLSDYSFDIQNLTWCDPSNPHDLSGWSVYELLPGFTVDSNRNLTSVTGRRHMNPEPLTTIGITHYEFTRDTNIVANNEPPATEVQVILDANGGRFEFTEPNDFGEVGGEAEFTFPVGNSLGASGYDIQIPEEDEDRFLGWSIYYWLEIPDPENPNSTVYGWKQYIDANGDPFLLTTNDVLTYYIGDNYKFAAQWEPYTMTFDAGTNGEFDVLSDGSTVAQDAQIYVFTLKHGETLIDYDVELVNIEKTDDPNATFYGWDRYCLVPELDANGDPVLNADGTPHMIEEAWDGPNPTEDYISFAGNRDFVMKANWTGTPCGSGPVDGGGSATPGPSQPTPTFILDPNFGSFEITDGTASALIDNVIVEGGVTPGDTLRVQQGLTDITNFKYWDGKRAFVGWNVFEAYIEYDDDGNEMWRDQILLTEQPITTAQLLDYPFIDGELTFMAVWAGDDSDYTTGVCFNACGGEFRIQWEPTDPNSIEVTNELGNMYKEDGKPLSTQISWVMQDPTHPDGYTFEGWLAVNEDGFRCFTPTTLYTTQQALNAPVPEDNTTYVAKWKEIPMDEYLYRNNFPEQEERIFLMNGMGGKLTLEYTEADYSDTLIDTAMALHPADDLSVADTLAEQGFTKFDLTASRTGHEFTGWTVYTAEALYLVDAPAGQSIPAAGYEAVPVFEWEDESDNACETNALLKNKTLYKDGMTTEELMKLASAKDIYAVANWKFVGKAESAIVPVEIEGSEEEYQLVVDTTLTVPAAAAYKYEDVSSMQQALKATAQQNTTVDKEKSITVYYEIKLQVKTDDGKWVDVTAEDFPKNGVKILIPYVEGADPKYYDFVITHLISSGDKAGEIEIVPHKETEDGLLATVYSLSPFAVTFQEGTIDPDAVPTPTPEATPTPAPNKNPNDVPPTGDNSHLFLFLALLVLGMTGAVITRRRATKG